MNGIQLDLAGRARRCIAHAMAGNATILIAQAGEIERAKAMVGVAPVIVCSASECAQFLTFMAKGGGGFRRARRGH
jgi:hypothetical protein